MCTEAEKNLLGGASRAELHAERDTPMMHLGYLVADPFRLTPEEEAGWRYLLGRHDVRNVLLPFDAIARRVPAVDLFWWHTDRQDHFPTAGRLSETRERLMRHVRGGAGLLLTLQAARFVTDLGVESVPPNRTIFEPWTDREGRGVVVFDQSRYAADVAAGSPNPGIAWNAVDSNIPMQGVGTPFYIQPRIGFCVESTLPSFSIIAQVT